MKLFKSLNDVTDQQKIAITISMVIVAVIYFIDGYIYGSLCSKLSNKNAAAKKSEE